MDITSRRGIFEVGKGEPICFWCFSAYQGKYNSGIGCNFSFLSPLLSKLTTTLETPANPPVGVTERGKSWVVDRVSELLSEYEALHTAVTVKVVLPAISLLSADTLRLEILVASVMQEFTLSKAVGKKE